uniref:condensation domain-containing protein n=1 Tax=Arhodomonas sp. AD133 TaxID=3415009 RepID=UPI003EBCA30A
MQQQTQPRVAERRDADPVTTDEIVRVTTVGEALPLSYPQQQLWFLQRYEPAMTAYNQPCAFRLTGELDAVALERAFRAVVRRHAVLRTRFHEQDGVPLQIVVSGVDFTLARDDLSGLEAGEREAALQRSIDAVAQHVFDLQAPPHLIARLIRLGHGEHVLVVCLHHIVSDAQSNRIIVTDLAEAYREALRYGDDATLADPRLQYGDFAVWQRRRVADGGIRRELAFWNEHLGPYVPALALPTDHPRPATQTFRGGVEHFALDDDLAATLHAFCRAQRCSPFVPLFAAWQVLLARYSGQTDFAVGVPSSGRHHDELQDVVGFFVTTLPFRVRLAPDLTLGELCQRLRGEALAALNHADVPLEPLLESRKPERDPAGNPLFQVMFGLQFRGEDDRFRLDEVLAEFVDLGQTTTKFDLSLDINIDGGHGGAALEFNADLFERQTIRRLVGYYRQVVKCLLETPGRKVGEIVLLDDDERQRLDAWGVNARCYPNPEPVHRLIERQAAATPQAPALVFGAQVLTYAELNARANRLAHELIARGVGPETRVGIAMERSPELVVGLLAIVKAGGAYVPLDPEHPRERLADMIGDSGLALVLTQQRLREGLPATEALTVVEVEGLDVSDRSTTDPAVALHGEHLAYVIYTSGSTGTP